MIVWQVCIAGNEAPRITNTMMLAVPTFCTISQLVFNYGVFNPRICEDSTD
jgi:hypothetical protein